MSTIRIRHRDENGRYVRSCAPGATPISQVVHRDEHGRYAKRPLTMNEYFSHAPSDPPVAVPPPRRSLWQRFLDILLLRWE